MSTDKEDLVIDDDLVLSTDDEPEPQVEVAKTNLDKRRTIDNLLEERRLQRQLADYDYDL
ncbi:PA3496 family putative envelope integrity protein [Pseudomonas sp. NPDC088322]|uniref:PA3496 family putative envelope integrity protein n=1 Tax=Pseudomonas sp. NPDC088322 TaxID=3364452 RepID=UPI00380EFF6D